MCAAIFNRRDYAPAPPLNRPQHPSGTVKGRVQVLLVDQPHQPQVFVRLAPARVVVRRTGQLQQLALLRDAQPLVAGRDPRSPFSGQTGQLFF